MNLTKRLSDEEFKRAIEIRKKQIKEIQARLKEWEDAASLVNPYWRLNLDWMFGQCGKAMSKDVRANKPRAAQEKQ